MPWRAFCRCGAPPEGILLILLAWTNRQFLFIRVYKYLHEIRIRQLFYACGVYGYLAGIKSKGRFIGMGKELAADDLIPVIAEASSSVTGMVFFSSFVCMFICVLLHI